MQRGSGVTRCEIILRTRYVIIGDRRPIAPINARIFALKLLAGRRRGETSPNRWVIDTKVYKGWYTNKGVYKQLQPAGSRVRAATPRALHSHVKSTREIDEKGRKDEGGREKTLFQFPRPENPFLLIESDNYSPSASSPAI